MMVKDSRWIDFVQICALRSLFLIFTLVAVALFSTFQSAYAREVIDPYTLYRDSPYIYERSGAPKPDEPDYMRVHIATFDRITSDPTYNKFMCERVKSLFLEKLTIAGNRPDYTSNFWCEPGRYKPNPYSEYVPERYKKVPK